MTTQLQIIQKPEELSIELLEAQSAKDLVLYFQTNGLQSLIDNVRKKADLLPKDASTKENRDKLRTEAAQLGKQKASLERLGKASIEDVKAQVKIVDSERIRAVKELDAIQDTIRKPLTDWEEAEKNRVARLENVLKATENSAVSNSEDLEVLNTLLQDVKTNANADLDFQEFAERIKIAREKAIAYLENRIESVKQSHSEKAELERLRKEKEERDRKDAEIAIAEKAKAEAEAKAKAEIERLTREIKEKEERALREVEAAKVKAGNERQQAIVAERVRAENEAKAKAEAEAKRAADALHTAKINTEILEAFVAEGILEYVAKSVITAIYQGKIPHVKIIY